VTGPDPRATFAEGVAALARTFDGVELVLADLSGFTLDAVLDTGEVFRLNLHNLWTATRPLEGSARADEIERQARAMFAPRAAPTSWSDVQDRLRPALRPASVFDGVDVVRRVVLPHLVEAVAVDLPDAVAYLAPAQLVAWARAPAEAFATARGNLRPLASDGLDVFHSRIDRRLWSVEPEDAFAPSRLLLDGWLAGLAERLGGPPVAAVPHRSALLIGRADDAGVVEELARYAVAEYLAAPGPLSPALYGIDERRAVVPLTVPDEHPAAPLVRAGHDLLAEHERTSGG